MTAATKPRRLVATAGPQILEDLMPRGLGWLKREVVRMEADASQIAANVAAWKQEKGATLSGTKAPRLKGFKVQVWFRSEEDTPTRRAAYSPIAASYTVTAPNALEAAKLAARSAGLKPGDWDVGHRPPYVVRVG